MRRQSWINVVAIACVLTGALLIVARNVEGGTSPRLLNVSYDPTRELYDRLNRAFVESYRQRTGREVQIRQSHGGSSHQARTVASGEQVADVVTLGLFPDIDSLRKRGLLAANWAERLPCHSHPYTSTIVFVVRKGNPRQIHDWPDLIRAGVEVVTPNPRSSGNGKLSVLAAWGAVVTRGGNDAEALAYLRQLFAHTAAMDAGARGAAITFAVQEVGDVHLTWENEAIREVAEAKGRLELIYPPVSILAEPVVAWVDANVARHHTGADARAYLEYLFSDEAQAIIAELGYRPVSPTVAARQAATLPPITLFAVTALAHDWDDAQQRFFAENGIVDTALDSQPGWTR